MPESILFWPGREKNANVLAYFLSILKNIHAIENVSLEYDRGEAPFAPNSEWVTELKKNNHKWWIGISLGASLAYTFASLLNETDKPERLTLINPFASRSELSKEKGFSMNGQWDFSPINSELYIKRIEIVVSVFDEKIPIYHGISLLYKSTSVTKSLIFIDDKHQIQNESAQKELAYVLLNKKKTAEVQYGKTHYCNIYQQQ